MTEEKRNSPRCTISQLVQMRHGYERWRTGEVVDISCGGLRCTSSYQFSPGDTVFFLLDLDGNASIRVDATAMHVQEVEDQVFETGFSFTRFYDGSQPVLSEFIEQTDGIDGGCRDET
ncbi:MAG: PilZ domain-containing protein [Spirochaetota bacterium]